MKTAEKPGGSPVCGAKGRVPFFNRRETADPAGLFWSASGVGTTNAAQAGLSRQVQRVAVPHCLSRVTGRPPRLDRWRGWSSLRVMVSWTGSGRRPAPSSSSEDDHGALTWTARRRNAYLTSFTRTAPRQVENADGPRSSEAVIGVGERSRQLRPYVRPAARRLPLAIMGARARVRRRSMAACSGHSAPFGVA